jgi:transposase
MHQIIAGIDIHKRRITVVASGCGEPEERQQKAEFGSGAQERERLRVWLRAQGVTLVVMESTAQYWRPVWMALEGEFELQLAQARSNCGVKGRKTDFGDTQRLVRRWWAGELILSFVPEAEQRAWRMVSRSRQQLVEDRGRLQNQLEALLEEMQIKLSSVVSDLLGSSGRRILEAMAAGESDAEQLAALADYRLRTRRQDLADALRGRVTELHRRMLERHLERLRLLDRQIEDIAQDLSRCLEQHKQTVQRLAEVPGMGVEAAQQILAEAGVQAQPFASPAQFASWIGVCPGRQESAGESHSNRSPKGNRPLRRVLTQVAWAAARTKNSFFQGLFQRLAPKLGAQKAIWAVAHRLARVIWVILHRQVPYEERGLRALDSAAIERRKNQLVKRLRTMGYAVQLQPLPTS